MNVFLKSSFKYRRLGAKNPGKTSKSSYKSYTDLSKLRRKIIIFRSKFSFSDVLPALFACRFKRGFRKHDVLHSLRSCSASPVEFFRMGRPQDKPYRKRQTVRYRQISMIRLFSYGTPSRLTLQEWRTIFDSICLSKTNKISCFHPRTPGFNVGCWVFLSFYLFI